MAVFQFALFLTTLIVLLDLAVATRDKVHLQWAICDQDDQTVLRKLGYAGMEPYKANNVTYYDTVPPVYTAKGLAFRTKVQKQQFISMVKARFDSEIGDDEVPTGTDCVWDQYGDSTWFTCGLSASQSDLTGSLWSDDQVDFAERYQSVDWQALRPYGPYWDPKWKIHVGRYKATFDDVMVDIGGSTVHLMELEVKVKRSHGEHAHSRISNHLRRRGIILCDPQSQTKTARLFDALKQLPITKQDNEEPMLSDQTEWELK